MADVEEKSYGAELSQSTTWLFIMNLAALLSSMLILAFATRILETTEEIGLMTFMITIRLLLVTGLGFGLPHATGKFIADAIGAEKPRLAGLLFRRMTQLGLIIGILAALSLAIPAQWISITLLDMPESYFLLGIFSIEIPATMLTQFQHAALAGSKEFKKSGLTGTSGHIIRAAVGIWLLIVGYGLMGIIIAWICGAWLEAILRYIHNIRIYSGETGGSIDTKRMRAFAGPIYGAAIVEYGSNYIERYLILILLSTAALGLYAPAVTTASLTMLVPIAFGGVLFPHYAQMIGAGKKSELAELTRGVSRWFYLVFVPMVFGVMIESLPIITLVAGTSYIEAAPILSVLCIGLLGSGAYWVLRGIILGLGYSRMLLIGNIVAITVGGLSSIMLIGAFGLIGAAAARIILFTVQLIIPIILIRRKEVLSTDLTTLRKAVIAALGMTAVLFVLNQFGESIILMAIHIVIGVALYSLFLRLQKAIRPEDILIIRGLLPTSLGFLVNIIEKVLVSPD